MFKNHEQWVDAHFLYQPTAADEAVLTILERNGGGGGAKRGATRRRL